MRLISRLNENEPFSGNTTPPGAGGVTGGRGAGTSETNEPLKFRSAARTVGVVTSSPAAAIEAIFPSNLIILLPV
jgi:hypothetical protein